MKDNVVRPLWFDGFFYVLFFSFHPFTMCLCCEAGFYEPGDYFFLDFGC